MKNILTELFYGNIKPFESAYLNGGDYQKAVKLACTLESALLEQLDDQGKELYDLLNLINYEIYKLEDEMAFSDAFKLGARIALDILNEDK